MDYPGKIIRKTAVTPSQTSAPGVWTLEDAAAATKTNTWPVAGVPNPISRSLRFNSADSAYLSRTFGSAGNRTTWTWSCWIKSNVSNTSQQIFTAANLSSPFDQTDLIITSGNVLRFTDGDTTIYGRLTTTAVYRDPSAWYHIVAVWDTGNATAGERMRLYVNGAEVTAFSTDTQPSQNRNSYWNTATTHNIGRYQGNSDYLNAYLTEIYFIDGQALTPSSFGMTDPNTGAWIPIKYTGTYGTNGFYLNFKDNSSTGTLGYDYSGNGNNWTANNFSVTAGAGNDSLTDVPTPWIAYNTTGDVGGVVRGNYCTWNPLSNLSGQMTLTNGNLDAAGQTNSTWQSCFGTLAMPTSGKWFFEITISTSAQTMVGITRSDAPASASNDYTGNTIYGYEYYSFNGNKYNSGSASAYGASYTTGDVIGVAFDADNGTLVFYKNGVSQGTAYTGLTGYSYYPTMSSLLLSSPHVANFGQRPFAYTPPAGFVSLCTTNLPTPTIGATSTTQAGKYMNVVLWSGTGGARTISGLGFQPDWVWGKGRSGSATYPHLVWDVLRGTNINLVPNTTDAEFNAATSSSNGGLGTSASDGFTIVAGSSSADNLNASSPASTYVGWAWKANGAGSSNTAGSITSTVSANTTSGFSIVTYTGNGTSATVGHGLGIAPSMIIVKSRGATGDWTIFHSSLQTGRTLYFDTSAQSATGWWNNTAPTSTVFSLSGTGYTQNNNGTTYVAYCFAPVAGYSAFGSYTGNGSTDGPFIYLGFRPRYILTKNTEQAGQWFVWDAARSPFNAANDCLFPESSQAETADNSALDIDLVSNGFKIRNTGSGQNNSTKVYIYAAFAEFPFKFSNAR